MTYKDSNIQKCIQDDKGIYLKDMYIKKIISETKELIKYEEGIIAIENLLDNLCEVSLSVDAHTIALIHKAFDEKVPERIERSLDSLTKQ